MCRVLSGDTGENIKSLGVIIPFYNEENSLEKVVTELVYDLEKLKLKYSVILVNDGSRDGSSEIADMLVLQNKNINVIHLKKNMNLGHAYRVGLKYLKTDYVTWIPSDGEVPTELIARAFSQINNESFVLTYPVNSYRVRALHRYVLSVAFQSLCRLVFVTNVKYFNCSAIYERKKIETMSLISKGFTINLELVVRSLALDNKFIEVPFELCKRTGGREKALGIRNIRSTLVELCRIWFDITLNK